MNEEKYYKLKSGTIIRKDILAITFFAVGYDSTGNIPIPTYLVTFAENQTSCVYINQQDYEELKEML